MPASSVSSASNPTSSRAPWRSPGSSGPSASRWRSAAFTSAACISMLKNLTPELQEAVDLGITLFAGEAEEHFGSFLQDVHAGRAKPLYNYMDDLPNLQDQTIALSAAASWSSGTTASCPRSTPGAAARSSARSAPSSTSRAANHAGAAPTTSSSIVRHNADAGHLPLLHHRRQLRPQQELGADLRPAHRAAETEGLEASTS